MRKFILLSASLLFAIFVLVSFSSKKKTIQVMTKPASSVISCLPPAAPTVMLMTAAAFHAKYGIGEVKVRKNVDALSTVDLNALKVGIIKMKALPYTNPTSWLYQAAIHGTLLTDNLPSWNTCHKIGEEPFFLAWHRMYVYFFERIMRAKSGRANLTLPYWNYQTDPVLHPAYRDNSRGNPLYDATRTAAINSGGALPASIMTAFNNSLTILPYYAFQTNLTTGPHGAVHSSIAGNMGAVTKAAKDPVFWLHHSNIDRLWEVWLGKCGGRMNPIDTTWLNKIYTFFDENGTAVSLKGSQVVTIATQLNYRYDSLPPAPGCTGARTIFVSRETLLSKSSAVEIKGQTHKANFSQEATGQLDAFIKKTKRTNFSFASKATPERLEIIFNGVKITQMPEGVVEVYLNLPEGVKTPDYKSKNFVGLLDLFSAEHHSEHPSAEMKNGDKIELDATIAAEALKLTLSGLKNSNVSFFVRGNTLNGREVKTTAQITIQRIDFSVAEFKN